MTEQCEEFEMTKKNVVSKITDELSKLCVKPLTEQTAITAKYKVEAILAMALAQGEIDGFTNVNGTLVRRNYILVEATINNSLTTWELSKKLAVHDEAISAYDRAMKGI